MLICATSLLSGNAKPSRHRIQRSIYSFFVASIHVYSLSVCASVCIRAKSEKQLLPLQKFTTSSCWSSKLHYRATRNWKQKLAVTRKPNWDCILHWSYPYVCTGQETRAMRKADNSSLSYDITAANFKHKWSDHVKNIAVSEKTGLNDLSLIIADRYHSLFGHICQLSPEVLCIDGSSGILPAQDWKGPPGRPRRTWLSKAATCSYGSVNAMQ